MDIETCINMIYTTRLSIVSLPLVVKIWPLLVYYDC